MAQSDNKARGVIDLSRPVALSFEKFCMNYLPIVLLRDRPVFLESVRQQDLLWRDLLSMVAFVVVVCSVYGAVLAGWRSPLLSMYVAVKLPMLFIGTISIVSLFNWMTATLLGSGLSMKTTIILAFASMTITCWILLGLIPVAVFFIGSCVPQAGTPSELQYAHNTILITHITILGLAGIAGNIALLKGLRSVVRSQCPVNVLFVLWVSAFTFVGCQMSWILRPFVGSPFYPVAFMRSDALQRNFYEFVFSEVFPYLLWGGK